MLLSSTVRSVTRRGVQFLLKHFNHTVTTLNCFYRYAIFHRAQKKSSEAIRPTKCVKRINRGISTGLFLRTLIMESIPNRSPIIFGIRIIFFVYLDDHKIYTSGDSIKKAVQELMRKTEKVTEWYKVNLLKANSSVDLKLLKKELVDQLLLQIDDQEVKSLGKRTILKVIIEDELTFSEPIRNISKRDSQTFRVFLRLSDIISCFAKLQLYKSTILTHVMYHETVW